jgi:DHA2 family multidrug resistance protein-like MFS transporter
VTVIPRAGQREWLGLAVIALPCLLYSMDLTVLNLALPRISAALRPSGPELLWIVDIYGFLLAGFLIPMGTLGDRIGRRRLLLIGAIAFGAASILAAFATSALLLIAARAILGVAASTLAPSTLSLIRNMFLDARQRTLAISVWVMSFSAGAALGPLLGGLLLQRFWWGSVFLLAVPIMLLLLILGPVLLPEYRDPNPRRLDLASASLPLIGVLLVIFGLKQVAQDGVSWLPALAMAAGLIAGAVFLRRQQRLADPLVDLRLFQIPSFSSALAVNLLGLLAFDGAFLLIAQYLQLVAGLSPWEAGLWTLPWAGGLIVGSVVGPLLVRWVSPQIAITAVLVVAAIGFALLTQVGATSGLVVTAIGSVVFSLGVTPAIALATDLIVGAAPPERAGVASGMSETSTELGGALGIALLGSMGAAVYRSQLVLPGSVPAGAVAAARNTLAGALAVADQLPAPQAALLRDASRSAFTQGLHVTGLTSAAIVLGLAIMSWVVWRKSPTDLDRRSGDG